MGKRTHLRETLKIQRVIDFITHRSAILQHSFSFSNKFPLSKYKHPLSCRQSRSLCHRFYFVIRRSRVRNSAPSSCSVSFAVVNVWSRYVVNYCT